MKPLQHIKRHCRECMGYDGYRGQKALMTEGEAASEVKRCTDTNCQLYHLRNGKDETPGRVKQVQRPPTEKQLAAREKFKARAIQSIRGSGS